MVEGKGNVPPAPRQVFISDTDMRCIIDACSQALNRYTRRTDTWGKGQLANAVLPRLAKVDPVIRPSVAGKCGEVAVRELAVRQFGASACPPVDFNRRAKGDGGIDLHIGHTPVQVKTRVQCAENLIRASDSHGNPLGLQGKLHVFCAWHLNSWIHVLGWLPNSAIAGMPIEWNYSREWRNFVVPDSELLPMNRLWAGIEWRVAQ